MRKLLRVLVYATAAVLLVGAAAAVYLLLIDGAAPPPRPGLVRLPENAPPPPRGYPTMNALYLAYLLGRVEILDPHGDIPVPEGVVEQRGVEYGRVDGRPLLLDLYAPEDASEPLPGLIFIHGGGWQSGDKSDYKYYTVRFAKRNCVAATIGYRHIGEAKFPAAIEDAKCAVRWMRANAEKLHVNPGQIVVIGGSAGGHLALMAGYTADTGLFVNGGHEDASGAVAGVVDLYGPVDLTTPEARTNSTVTAFFDHSYAEDPEPYRLASPIHHLHPGAPPTLIIQGTIDDIMPVGQSDALAERLQALNVPYWYDRVEGYPHTMDVAPAINERVQWLISAFLDRFIRKQ